MGWKLADLIVELAEELDAKEIISLEGVGSPHPEEGRVFYYANRDSNYSKKLEGIARPLMEGIIVGATGALLAKDIKLPLVAFFAEAQSNMPDSKAAAEIIKAVDAYTGLKVDPKPLLKQAAMFEEKLKGIMEKSQKAEEIQDNKKLAYVG
jgi:predicted ATP-grasp superfamily ATP-dependent carboligase